MQATASSQKVSSPPGEFSRGKTIFVLAVVIGCFTILWPKIFYPMLTASLSGDDTECCDVISEQDANAYNLMNQICARIVEREKRVATETLQQQQQNQSGQGQAPPATKGSPAGRKMYTPPPARLPSHIVCRNEILKTCGLDVLVLVDESPKMSRQYKVSLAKLRSYNTSQCLKENYGVDFHTVGLPRRFRNPEAHLSPSHMRPERPIHFHRPEPVHPAMKERGAAIPHTIPQRTLEKEARPGPFPGVRPPVGGAGFQAPAPKGGGTMGIIMPLYTIAIVVFFVYTIMKILFRKPEEKPQPILKDFHMDPEHRKFVFAEEYQAGSERSMKDQMKKEEQQENQGLRKRSLSSTKSGSVDRSRLEPEVQLPETPPPAPESESPIELFQSIRPLQKEPQISVERKSSQQLMIEKRILEERPLAAGPKVELFNELKPILTDKPLARQEKFPVEIKLGKVLVKERKRLSIDHSTPPCLQIEPPTPDEQKKVLELFSELKPMQKETAVAVEPKYPEEMKLGRIPVTEKLVSETSLAGEDAELYNELRPIQTEAKIAVEQKHPQEIKLGQILVTEKRPSLTSSEPIQLFNDLKPIQTEPRLAYEEKHPEEIKLGKMLVKKKRLSVDSSIRPIQLFSDLRPIQKEPRLSVDLRVPIKLALGKIPLREKRLSQPDLGRIRLRQKRLSLQAPLQLYSELRPILKETHIAKEVKFPEDIRLGIIPVKEKRLSQPDLGRVQLGEKRLSLQQPLHLYSDLRPILKQTQIAKDEKFPEEIRMGKIPVKQKRVSIAGPVAEEPLERFSALKPLQKERPLAKEEKYPEVLKIQGILMKSKPFDSSEKADQQATESGPIEGPSAAVGSQQTSPPSQNKLNVDLGDDEQMTELECLKDSGMRDRDARDIEIDLLRKRLEETEAAMERIVQQMGTVSDRLSPSNLAPVLNETQVNHKSSSKLANSTAQQEVTPEKSALTPTEATAPSKVQEEVELIAKPKKVKILEVPQTLEGRSAEVTEDEEDEEQEPEDRPAPLIPEPQPRPDDEEDEEEEEELEEEIPVRPPTPPKSKRQASTDSTAAITKYAETLANRVVKLGEQEAAKVLQLESQSPPRTSSPSVGVVNLEGTLEMANGHKLRSPTPPNVRTLSMSPLPPHESAPEVSKEKEQVPSIVLEGHIPSAASSVLISALSDSQDELRHLGDDDDEEAEELEQDSVSSPVVLSGKVTLSVIAGGPADDQPTEATSLSVDDYAKAISAADSTQPATADAEEDEEEEEEEEDEEEDEEEEEELPVRQAPTAAKTNQANGGIAQQNGTKGESKEDGEGTHYTTADKGETADNQAEETAEDISALEGLDDGRQDDILPSDTEDEAEEEEDVEDEEEEDEEEEEEEEDEDENLPNNVPNKGPPV